MERQDVLVLLLLQAMGGGATRNTFDIYTGLKARGWRTHLVVSTLGVASRYQKEMDSFEKADVDWIPMCRAPHPSDVVAYWKIRNSIKQWRGRVILHAHSTKAGMLGHVLNPIVYASVFSPHAYRGIDPTLRGPSKAIIEGVESRYSSTYDRVVAEVPLEFDYGLKIGVPREKLRLIPNGIPIDSGSFDRIRSRRKKLPDTPTLGFVGRLVYQKNPLLFVKVLDEVVKRGCNAKAIVLGDGPLKGEMIQLAEHYGIAGRIDWRGEIPVADVYPEMDVLVHTSIYEAMAYSLIEASGALLQTVATTNPGSCAVLGRHFPQNLISSAEPQDLAKAVMRIVEDNYQRREQMDILERMAREYSTENMLCSLEAEYLALLKGNCRPR